MKLYFFVVFIFVCFVSFGQSIEREVVGAGGAYYSNGSAQMSVSFGEPMIETYSSGSNELTQGFQQSKIIVTEIQENEWNTSLQVFPNPTANYINITSESEVTGILLKIVDVQGKLLLENKLLERNSTIDVMSFSTGIYFILITKDNQLVSKFKMVKE